MTKNGSKIMQSPKLVDGDLVVSKIDYLDTGRIVVTGKALPRLRVSLSLNGKYIGFSRVSDYKNFGLGANVEKLESGKKYEISIRLHDGEGTTIATVSHKFVMPEMTGDDNTFYTVRRGDCLWIIARNFLRRGVLFTMIAERNNIKNPDLIFPNQNLQIPVK
nr:LysM peptidoglycan-binding domain-containing protein [Candidatus Enterousia merdequi]